MKKILLVLGIILVIPLITVEKVNNKSYYLETETDTYTKEEIDSKINELLTKINDNTTKITEAKNILTEIKNKLDDYALKTALNKTNEDITTLDELAKSNKTKIDNLENLYNQGTATAEDIAVGKTAIVNGKLIIGTMEPGDSCPYSIGEVWDYPYSTTQSSLLIPCKGIYKIEVAGTGVSGKGTLATGYSLLTRKDTLYINSGTVGAGGVKGGDCYGQAGGGASFVRLNTSDGEPLIVAGGGGGYTSFREGVGSLGAVTTTAGNSTPSSNSIRNQGSTGNYYSDSAGTDNHQYRQSMGGGGGGYYGGSAGICYRNDTRCWNWTGGYAGTSFIDFEKVKNYDETTKSLTSIEYTGTNGENDFTTNNVNYGAISGNGYVKVTLISF